MTNNMLPIGTLLRGGTYRVTRQLNSGGFGNIYVVENVHFHETYAMKEFFMQGTTTRRGNTVSVSLSDNAGAFASQKEKFKKEAQRIRRLNHPNIVKIYDLFEENNTCYYIMDYIDGASLAERLKRQGSMTESEALQVLESLLDALSAVHAAGFTHMDIKPGNIMQDRRGKIYLIDFGASKQMTIAEERTLSTSTAMPYSDGYAPIEQVERKLENVGPWTDLYAVGATLYKLLTNCQPPSSSKIINESNPFVFPSRISESTQSLVKWMMQPGRDRRPKSVSDVRFRFRNYCGLRIGKSNDETIFDKINDGSPSRLSRTTPKSSQYTLKGSNDTNNYNKKKSGNNEQKFNWKLVVAFCLLVTIFSIVLNIKENTSTLSKKENTSTLSKKENTSTLSKKESKTIHFCPDDNHPHAIDLGLPSGTKWACCDIGASKPEERGHFYQWGVGYSLKDRYDHEESDRYPYFNKNKDCILIGNYVTGVKVWKYWGQWPKDDNYKGLDISGTDYDTAKNNWGKLWKMPNDMQGLELTEKCNFCRYRLNGKTGILVKGLNGKSIFFPIIEGIVGEYWLSLAVEFDNSFNQALTLEVNSNGDKISSAPRDNSCLIRPITN